MWGRASTPLRSWFCAADEHRTARVAREHGTARVSKRSPASVLLVWVATCSAQSIGGQFHLLVQDPTGAPMEVSGRLEGPVRQTARTFQTNSLGSYIFENLAYGTYRLELTKIGFTSQVLTIEVKSQEPVTRSVTMALQTQAFE